MKAIITISAICILLTVGCNRNPENPDKLRTILFERCIETEQKMKISEIADTIEYLESVSYTHLTLPTNSLV